MKHAHLQRGFTLIEVMVVAAIIGLIAAVAIPSYTSYIARTHRADARANLLQAAQFMQRFYAANDAFDKARPDAAGVEAPINSEMPAALKQSPANGTAVYSIAISATADEYTLTMAPVAGGRMATDSCGSYVINSLGRTSNQKDGEDLPTAARDACWK